MSTPTAKLIKSGDIWQIEGYYAYRNRVRRRESTNMISRPRENFRVLNVFHPPNIPGKSMVVGVIDMDPNGATPSHTHGGAAVVAMVASGTVLNQMNCEEPIVSKAGDIWYEAPGCHHVRSENAGGGSETARFFAVLIVDDEVIRDGVHNIFVLDIEKAEKESAHLTLLNRVPPLFGSVFILTVFEHKTHTYTSYNNMNVLELDLAGSFHQSKPARRVGLACAPCRKKHLRCDARTPVCARCIADNKQCVYEKSRRGGRRRKPSESASGLGSGGNSTASSALLTPGLPADQLWVPSSSPESVMVPAVQAQARSTTSGLTTHPTPSATAENDALRTDRLYNLYYTFFHPAHPCVLPWRFLSQRLETERETIQPLLYVMQYIGAHYADDVDASPLATISESQLAPIRSKQAAATGFDVQAMILYSIAVYWCDEIDRGVNLLKEAIQMALDIQMNKKDYATNFGQNDPMLEESWRRTWWLVYITDAHVAGSTHVYPFRTSNIDMSVDLPCEEEDYEAGVICPPTTLEVYDIREFLPEADRPSFSSYAELIGLTRSIDKALASDWSKNAALVHTICENADISVAAWHSLLPPCKRDPLRSDGTVDEIMFKAKFILHAYAIEIHRPLSTLAYSSVESTCKCAPPVPAEDAPGSDTTQIQLHTLKCLHAIEQLGRLMILPANIHAHTPFIICMIANATIAHLAACRYVFAGPDLQLGRERIRLSMGTLKRLSEHWGQGKRIYREMGIVAREILSLADQGKDSHDQVRFSTKGTLSGMPNTPAALEFPSFDMHNINVAEFDFCGYFDGAIGEVVEPASFLVV
ncbi:hypothetical protein AAWM_01873 [Aspergillus awamori]|uniref:Zn(2)-C6 fungal-type domain-containing protein n=1 Tax=Aspergillus awamori TaxID=105351 RepID=A0A401KI22_ASPAW|nr:hypothetical protein AAWM_01873 [Aspergillus awamori]